jgi:Pyrimidine dimer DNA glycosylase
LRLWSLHPKYLDGPGLVALWREALLAQAVLRGGTRGYGHHPQLARFREVASPCGGIARYLRGVHAESLTRGYAFAAGKISRARCLERATALQSIRRPEVHPLFTIVRGPLEEWERK